MRLCDATTLGFLLVLSVSEALAQSAPAGQSPAQITRAPGRASPAMATPVPAGPRTLQEALAATYANNPTLQAARAKLRATDEGVPQALAGWRPTLVVNGTAGYADGIKRDGRSKAETARDVTAASTTPDAATVSGVGAPVPAPMQRKTG